MPKTAYIRKTADSFIPVYAYHYLEVEDPSLVRWGRRPSTEPGYGGISAEFWGRILRHARGRGIEVNLTAQQAWDKYLEQGGCCALTGLPIWFSPGEELGGGEWLSSVLCRWEHPKAFDAGVFGISDMLHEKGNQVTASLDRIHSGGPYSPANVQWVHKRIQGMKMHLREREFIHWCRCVASYHSDLT